jgi:hypothetical protein
MTVKMDGNIIIEVLEGPYFSLDGRLIFLHPIDSISDGANRT